MSTEEDIGALKKGMDNVEGATERTADRVDELVTKFIEHSTAQTARMDRAEERHDDLHDVVGNLKTRHYKLAQDTPSQKKIMAVLVVVASAAGGAGSFITSLFKAHP